MRYATHAMPKSFVVGVTYMPQTSQAVPQEGAVRRFVYMRWAIVAAVFGLERMLALFSNGAVQPPRMLLYAAAGYVCVNIFLALILRSATRKKSSTSGVAALGFVIDGAFFLAFGYMSPPAFHAVSFALFALLILEAAALFSEGVLLFTFFLASSFFGIVAQRFTQGEVLIERLAKLAPQELLLLLVLLFAWILHRTLREHSAQLTHSRELTETVVTYLPEGVLILDSDGRVLFMNRSGESLLGVREQEVLGLKIKAQLAYPIQHGANLLKVVHSVAEQEGPADVQLEYPEERLLKVLRMPLTEAGGALNGHMFVFRDVTREAVLSKIKSDFISVAAHQLRTPLSSIKWAFAMLQEGGLGELSENQKPVVQQGLETSDRLVRLVNSLLNVSRMEEGRFGYEFATLDARQLVLKVLTTLKAKSDSRGVAVRTTLPDALPAVAADAEKIELALENLVDNAVSYTQSGGEGHITAAIEGKFLRITVQDNGVGIPKSQLPNIYSKFFRGDNVVRMQTDGSGLGLYIAKNIVEKHGGVMALTSQEGVGTTASFTMPIV